MQIQDESAKETSGLHPNVRICHLTSGFGWGGLEAHVATVVPALARFTGQEVSVLLLSEGRLADQLRRSGVAVSVVPAERLGYTGAFCAARRILRDKDVHVLHSHRYNEHLMAVALAAACRIPHLVRTEHGHTEPYSKIMGLRHALVVQADRIARNHFFDRVISVSAGLFAEFAFLPPGKVELVRNGIDVEGVRSSLSAAEAKARLGLDADTVAIGFVGRLEQVKRVDIFLQTARALTDSRPDCRFLVLGEGRSEAALRSLTAQLDLGGNVQFLGQREDACDIMRALDLLLICSDNEGLPLALLEAMANGVPVVARKVGGVPEVIEDDVSGVLVDSADPGALARACMRVLDDPGLRSRIAQAAPVVVQQRFSVQANAAGLRDVYLSLVAGDAQQLRRTIATA